jgi:L-cystine transport system substrate-binding protein
MSLASIILLTACGTNNETKTSDANVKTIIVGTGNHYEPYCYLEKDGNLSGYEYEVLKAVNELLPQYKFEFQTYDFAKCAYFTRCWEN